MSVFLLTGCNTLPPLSDQLALVPATGKAEATPGIDLTYLSGTNEGILTHISCDREQNCWSSGVLGKFQLDVTRLNSLVVRTSGISHIQWAHTYQINDTYTETNGFVPTPDGGALLYGNTFISHFSGNTPEPVYEKLDAAGVPQWGGALLIGGFAPWSAFSDAIRLQGGGYLLAGSGYLDKHYWYGILLKIGASGQLVWAKSLHSRKDSTLVSRIVQLANGSILVVGINAKLNDIVLFRISQSGKLLGSSILDTRGTEVPIGLTSLPDGLDIAVDQKMPNGEEAAIVLGLDKSGNLKTAERYHYIDGFSPNSIVALGTKAICLYGTTTAKDKPQSIALALNAKRQPVSALVLTGSGTFNSASPYRSGTIVFAGNRKLGADERMTPLLTRWSPELKNDPNALKNIRHDIVAITLHTNAAATLSSWDKPKLKLLQPGNLPFRSIYGTSAATSTGGKSSP